jgi:hypothetical protein
VSRALVSKGLGPVGGSSESIASAIKWAVDGRERHLDVARHGLPRPGRVLAGQGLPVALAASRAISVAPPAAAL